MKNNSVRVIIICTLLIGCGLSKASKSNSQLTQLRKIDSVMNLYFDELERSLNQLEYSSSEDIDISEVNLFMEKLTKIESNSDHGYLGIIEIDEATFFSWKDWYERNKGLLVWEKERINRSDFNIYND